MINSVLCVTLYAIEGELDRYRVFAMGEDGCTVDVTDQYELVGVEGREGFAVVRRLGPIPVHTGPYRRDDDG